MALASGSEGARRCRCTTDVKALRLKTMALSAATTWLSTNMPSPPPRPPHPPRLYRPPSSSSHLRPPLCPRPRLSSSSRWSLSSPSSSSSSVAPRQYCLAS
eukprot:14479427-Alexandrium_andersonii.AAC.1